MNCTVNSSEMPQRRAIVTESLGKAAIVNVPMPAVGPRGALVKTTAIAFNPMDQYCIDYYSGAGCVVGCDFAGVVVSVGKEVEQDLQPGDRVCGYAHGCNSDAMDVVSQLFSQTDRGRASKHEEGAFSTHVIAQGDLLMKIPSSISDEQAASLPCGLVAAGTALYYIMHFPMPDNPLPRRKPIFIHGGTTGAGAYAIQLAKLSGLQVITTCSPQNFDYVKSLGADMVFDYHSPTLAADIRRACPMISDIMDCVAEYEQETPATCAKIMCLAGGTYLPTMPIRMERDDVRQPVMATFSVFGDSFILGPLDIPAMPEHHAWGKKWFRTAINLVEAGKLKPRRVNAMDGGLEGMLKTINDHREGVRFSGYKVVYRISS